LIGEVGYNVSFASIDRRICDAISCIVMQSLQSKPGVVNGPKKLREAGIIDEIEKSGNEFIHQFCQPIILDVAWHFLKA
jgi:arginase family enzyme